MTTRLLLPFTHGVDMGALEIAALLAQRCNATLVPLALIAAPADKAGPRLEHIQESQDFLVAAACKAARRSVPIEQRQLYTSDIVASISAYRQKGECSSILLFERNGQSLLLSASEIKELLVQESQMVAIAHLPCRENLRLSDRIRNWLSELKTPDSNRPHIALSRPSILWGDIHEGGEWIPIIACAPRTCKGGNPLSVRDVEPAERLGVYETAV